MRKLLIVWIVLICTFSVSVLAENRGLSLNECYQLALKRSESIAINQESIKEAQAQILSSFSGVLPQINYQIYSSWQDNGITGESSQRSRYRRFTFTQPLFSGFKEFAAIAAAKANKQQNKFQFERAKQLLFIDVSDAFYFVVAYQEDLEVLDEIIKALKQRVDELSRRVGLGRARKSELASAQASLYKLEADWQGVKIQLVVGRQLLKYLIGQDVDLLNDEPLPNDSLVNLADFAKHAKARADVKAAQEGLVYAKKNVTVAQAGFWPTVNLTGNAYDRRTGASKNVAWDIGLSFSLPVFNGTETFGELQAAKSLRHQAQLILSQTIRKAELDIQNAYTRFVLSQKMQDALEKSSTAAMNSYELLKEDYANSLTSNLDVLNALEDYENAKRGYMQAMYETKRYYWQLKVAVGE